MLFSPPQGYEPTSRKISTLHLPGIQPQRDTRVRRRPGESPRCREQYPSVKEAAVTPDLFEGRLPPDAEPRTGGPPHSEISPEVEPDGGVCGRSCPAFWEFAPVGIRREPEGFRFPLPSISGFARSRFQRQALDDRARLASFVQQFPIGHCARRPTEWVESPN